MSELGNVSEETGLLVQATNDGLVIQDAQKPNKQPAAEAPVSKDGLTLPGEPVPAVKDDQSESTAESTRSRSEKESAAKAALQDAARKLRDLAAATPYALEQDIKEIDQAIAELMGQRERVQMRPALNLLDCIHHPTPEQALPPPPPPRRSIVEVERKRQCEVQRLLMEEWQLRNAIKAGPTPPNFDGLPVIEVFYRNIPSALADPDSISSIDDFKEAHNNAHSQEKPQRVSINSSLLIKDLESISGLQLPTQPYILISPYKLLVHNWLGIRAALKRMQDELTAMELDENQDNGDPTLDPTNNQSPGVAEGQHQSNDEPKGGAMNANHHDGKRGNVDEIDAAQDGSDTPVVSAPLEGSSSPEATGEDNALGGIKAKLKLRINHLKVLVDFIKTDLGYLIGLKMKIQDASLESISFDETYHLYAPGDLIINKKASIDHLHQVYAVTGGRIRLGRYQNSYRPSGDEADDAPDAGIGTWTDLVVDCFRMRWDGTHIGPYRVTHRIRHYVGEMKIVDMDFYPVRFRDNYDNICNALEERGKKGLECHGHMKYEGLTVDAIGVLPKPQPYSTRSIEAPALTYESITGDSEGGKEIEGDVYVDMKSYQQTLHPAQRVFGKLRRVRPSVREVTENWSSVTIDYHIGDHDVDEARSDEFMTQCFYLINPKTPEELLGRTACLALLSRAIPVYAFRSREWVWVDVTKVDPIDKTEEARTRGWRDLVIHERYSRLLESLVNNHMSPTETKRIQSQKGEGIPTAQIDLIQGKGRGLVILLHGPPGTGKTSTAEAIAAYTGKPLYAITCGDIGLDANQVERKLVQHTKLAEKWGCVLLLDEADVFLARRGWNDVGRNALVSVFLRHLEYYSGIIFLTTNIVGLIDEAFKSRIHVALRYDTIDCDTTERIWRNLLRRIKHDNRTADVKITFDEDELLDFAMEHYEKHEEGESTWNARQIRNAFSTAIAMGQFDRLERIRQEDMRPDEVLTSGNKSLTMIKLTKRNFFKIADIADDFEHYINSVRGDDAENARLNQQRDDFFLQHRTPPRKKYNRAAYEDDPAPSSSTRRRGYQSSSHRSRPSFKGKSAAKKPSNRGETEERDSDELDESHHSSDVRSRRMRRSRKVPSDDDEAGRFDED